LNEAKQDPPAIEDALQSITTIKRPGSATDVEAIGKTLMRAVSAAGSDPQSWKLICLTIIHGRFHSKAPEAAAMKKKPKTGKLTSAGNGERLSFYILMAYLHCIAQNNLLELDTDSASKALEGIGRLVYNAGGSRDLCALIEHLLYHELDQAGILYLQKSEGNMKALCQAISSFLVPCLNGSEESCLPPILIHLLETAASLVDNDLTLIETKNKESVDRSLEGHAQKKQRLNLKIAEDGAFQSTINTFIPHHGRGKDSRKLVQTVAELMLWSKSATTKTNPRFCLSLGKLSEDLSDVETISTLHELQTIIRRFRKILNSSAREQGFSLCTSYEIDRKSINLDMIKTAKHGDVTRLQNLACKANDQGMMSLIVNRYLDPAKAIPAQSMYQLHREWISLQNDQNEKLDEIFFLKLQVQEVTVKVTINHLRRNLSEELHDKAASNIVASLDSKAECDAAAILVAAALDGQCICEEKQELDDSTILYIGDEVQSISSLTRVMTLLDRAFSSGEKAAVLPDQDPASTKNIHNLIDRHLRPGGMLLLFGSSDVKLDQRVLSKLQDECSTVHCHIIDDFASRMVREKAKVGDITVTLCWDDRADLDLHVICPNGNHIYYGHRQGGSVEGGGYLDVDMNIQGESVEPVENVFFGDAEKGIEADHGKYKIYVQIFSYHGDELEEGVPVPWRVRIEMDGKISQYYGECTGSGSSSDKTVVEFEYQGRTAPAPEAVGSALESSKLISVSSSVGSSLESIDQLMSLRQQRSEIEYVATLLDESNAGIENSSEIQPRPLVADRNSFHMTNRDRLYLVISKLPVQFHLEINRTFNCGTSLLDYTASIIAKQLTMDNIPVDELTRAHYDDSLVELVRAKMATFGV